MDPVLNLRLESCLAVITVEPGRLIIIWSPEISATLGSEEV